MPTPLDNIKKGIVTQNWELVDKGYKALTGESALSKPTKQTKKRTSVKKTSPKPKKISKPIPEIEEIELSMEDGVEIVKNDNTIIDLSEEKQRRQAMLETVRLTKKNKFVDSGTDCLEDKEFDKKIIARRSERRPPQEKLILTCDDCGRTYRVPAGQVYSVGSYICPMCMKRKYTGGS